MGKYIVVECGLASLGRAFLSYEDISCGFTSQINRRTGRHSKCVGRSVPVMRRMILLSCTSTRSVCHDLEYTGRLSEQQRADAEERSVAAFVYHEQPVNLERILFLLFSSKAVLFKWCL